MACSNHPQAVEAAWSSFVVLGFEVLCHHVFYQRLPKYLKRSVIALVCVSSFLGGVFAAICSVTGDFLTPWRIMIFLSCTINEILCFLFPLSTSVKLTPGLQWSDTIPAAGSLVLVVLFGLGLLLKNNDEQWLYAAPIGTRVAYAALAACRIARVEGGKDLNRKYFLYLLAVGITVSLTSACFLIAHLVGGVAQHLLLQCVTSLMYAAQGLAKVVIEALSANDDATASELAVTTSMNTEVRRSKSDQTLRSLDGAIVAQEV